MTSQSTDLIKWPIYRHHLIEIYGHIDIGDSVFLTPICRTSTPIQSCFIYFILVVLVDGIHDLEPHKTVLCITIRARVAPRHFLIWIRTLAHNFFLCVMTYPIYWWTRQKIHNTLIAVDRYLRLMGDKSIPDSAEPRLEWFCLVHPAVRDKRRVSEIDLSQPRHETAFWWRHNGPVTSQLTDPIKWRNYPFELMFKCAYINTHNKESMTQRYRISTNVQLCLIFLYISIWFES